MDNAKTMGATASCAPVSGKPMRDMLNLKSCYVHERRCTSNNSHATLKNMGGYDIITLLKMDRELREMFSGAFDLGLPHTGTDLMGSVQQA